MCSVVATVGCGRVKHTCLKVKPSGFRDRFYVEWDRWEFMSHPDSGYGSAVEPPGPVTTSQDSGLHPCLALTFSVMHLDLTKARRGWMVCWVTESWRLKEWSRPRWVPWLCDEWRGMQNEEARTGLGDGERQHQLSPPAPAYGLTSLSLGFLFSKIRNGYLCHLGCFEI